MTVARYQQATGNVRKNPVIAELEHYLRLNGQAESTIYGKLKTIQSLINNNVNLENPLSVKEYLLSKDITDGRKRNIANAYNDYAKLHGIEWEKPIYKRKRKPKTFLPSERLLDQIIASVPNKYPPFLQLLKETGIRGCEAWKLRWDYIDFDKRLVHVDPAKNGNARTLPISKKLVAMLNNLKRETDYVFKNGKLESFRGGFRTHRKVLAEKLAEPDILRCTFSVFRDFYASKTYAEFLSKSEVSLRLGHRRETSTEPYIIRQLLEDPKYVHGIAHNTKEEIQLIESGFEYIKDTSDGCSLWRKRSI
ncbi:MAG: tyrosine-type recombinase/integrase [Candidatus Odinarchaeia archaeon]